MNRKRFTTEQIIHKLREAEVIIAKGKLVAEACRQIGVVQQTYYRWRLTSEDVLERLAWLFVTRGVPEYIRSDNGSVFTATAVRTWLHKVGFHPVHRAG